MTTDCEGYFYTETALDIWKKRDWERENLMLKCLDTVHKENFFSRVKFMNGRLEADRLNGLAEDIWVDAQTDFIEKGRAGKLLIRETTYIGYYWSIFKYKFLDMQGRELVLKKAKEEFGVQQEDGNLPTPAELLENKGNPPGVTQLLQEMRSAISELGANCRQLYYWRHEKGWTLEQIAQEKKVQKETIAQTFARCKKSLKKVLLGRQTRQK